jgi:hypothetical protein
MRRLLNLWILTLALAVSGVLMAQTTLATITGLVTDANGAIVPGVKVEVTNTETNYKYTATSNEAGQYTVTGMLNGRYSFRAIASGFAPFLVENILLVERDMRRIDVGLQLGTVQNTIEVSSKGSLIETETARVSDVKEHELIWIAPLLLHRTADVIQMAPMATYNGNYGGYRVGGARNHQEEMVWDGISGASATGGMANGVMSDRTEAIQEVRMEAAGTSAEFNTVGQISLVSRAGTNQLHGSAFDLTLLRTGARETPSHLQGPPISSTSPVVRWADQFISLSFMTGAIRLSFSPVSSSSGLVAQSPPSSTRPCLWRLGEVATSQGCSQRPS